MALKFYGQFGSQDDEDKNKTPSQVAKEQVSTNGLKFYGQFSEVGAQSNSRMSQFKASEPTPTSTTAPTVAPKEQSLWDKIGSTVSQAIKSVIQGVTPKSQSPVISPIPEPTISPTTKPTGVSSKLPLTLDGSQPAPSATLNTGIYEKAQSIFEQIKPIIEKAPAQVAVEHIQDWLAKPENFSITQPLATMQQAVDKAFEASPEFRGYIKGAAGTYMNSMQSFDSMAKEKLTVPTDWFGKSRYTAGELIGGLVGLAAGGIILKPLQLGRAALPILFGITGQTSSPADLKVKQRIAKAPVDMLTGYLFGLVPQSAKVLSKETLKGAAAVAAIVTPTNFISYLIQGLSKEDAAKYAAKASIIQSLFHVAMVGVNQATSVQVKSKEGVVITPDEAKAQIQSTTMPDALKAELNKAIVTAEAQGKDIKVSAYAKKSAPISKVIGEKPTEAITGQKQGEALGFNFELVDKKQIPLLSDEGAPTVEQPPIKQPTTTITKTGTAVVAKTPAVSSDVSFQLNKAISTYVSDEGVYKKPDGTTEQTPALKELTEIAKDPEAQKITQQKVSEAIERGDIKTNEDGSITVYRVGSMRDDNRLTSVSFDKAAAESFREQASVTGADRPITAITIQPSDIKVYVGGTEKEILIQSKVPVQTYERGVHKGRPFLTGKPPIVAEPAFGLEVGDKVTQIGEYGKSGKDSSSHRVSDYPEDNPAIYRGTIEGVGLNGKQMVFEYNEGDKKVFFLYTMSEAGDRRELIAVNPNNGNILIHDPVFKKVEPTTPPSPTVEPTTPPQPQEPAKPKKAERVGESGSLEEIMREKIGTPLMDRYGKTIDKATKSELTDILIESKGFIPMSTKEPIKSAIDKILAKKKVKLTTDLETRPVLVYGGVNKKVFTDGYILIIDPVGADAINEDMHKLVTSKRAKDYQRANANTTFQQAEEYAQNEWDQNVNDEKMTYPPYTKVIPQARGTKLKIQGFFHDGLTPQVLLTDGKQQVILNSDYLARMRTYVGDDIDLYIQKDGSNLPVRVEKDGKLVGLIMPVRKNLEVPVKADGSFEGKEPKAPPKPPRGAGHADVGGYREDGSDYFTGNMKGVEFPELLQMAIKFTGDVPALKRFTTKLGVFYPVGRGAIKLNYEIFKNPSQAAKTFAHEIGHLVDYLPDRYMNRGNILGRIATLNHYLKRFMKESPTAPDEPITEQVKNALRKQAKELAKTKQLDALKPQDILDIWNSVEVKNKDLETYIAKLDAAQKKEILKSAIKGLIPEWVDFKAPDQKWQSIYERLLKEEIIKRKILDEKMVKQELKDLSQYWKPFDENASADFTKYRYSSVELYADAISVLLNDPEILRAKAPLFYKGFFNWLDNKPEVKKEFFDTWDLINRGEEAVFRDRQKAITDSEMEAEEKWRLKEQERHNVKRNLPYMLATLFQDKDAVLIGKIEKLIKEGKDIAPEDNPRYALHSLNYLDGEIRAWLDKKVVPVFDKANEVDNGWSLLNQILQWERAIYERGEMANPHGHNPKTAADSLRMLEKTTDPDDWKNLQEAKDLFREMVKDFIDFADKHGYYKPELIETMKANPAYSTYQVVDYLDENISPKVYKSKGTLKGVANTATSTVMKLISTYKAIARNDAKMSILETLSTFGDDEIEPAKTVFVNSKRPKQFIDPKDKNLELVIGVKNGEMVGYYVPKDIARSLNYHENEIVQAIAKVAKFVSATPIYRPIMTTINFGFQLGNLLSDFMRNWENYPDKNLFDAIKSFGAVSAEYAKVLPSAYRKAKRINDPLITDMRERRMLGVGFKGVFSDDELEASQKIERVLGKYGVADIEESNKIKAGLGKVWDAVSFFGEVIESLPKLAAYERIMSRTDISDQEKAEYIRTQAGSPDFRLGGTATPITNAVFMFSNAQIQAAVADWRSVGDDNYKPYRTAYFFKLIIGAIIPTLIAIAIKEGLFGEDMKKQQDNVSEYDKSNYNIIPMGFDENGKTRYVRVRKSERDRLIGGLIWKAARMFGSEKMGVSDLMEVFSYAGGQVPNLSPNFKLINGIMQYMSGINPYDDFRNRNVIPDTAFKAGQKDPKYSLPYMINWILDTTGARIAIPKVPYQGERMTPLEKILNLPILSNAIGKWVKVSDYGQTEKLQEIRKEVQSNAAIKSLDRREAIDNAIKEYNSGEKNYTRQRELENKLVEQVVGKVDTSEAKTSRTLLIKQFREGLIKGQADPITNAIIGATSNEEKVQLLKDARAKMEAGEFYRFVTGLYQDNLISRDVVRDARK